MRNDLNRLAEVIAPTFLFNNMRVDFTGRDVVIPGQGDVEVSLVIAEIKVGFAAVVEDIDFAWKRRRGLGYGFIMGDPGLTVLRWGHSSRINVHIRINLDGSDLETGRFEQQTGGRG